MSRVRVNQYHKIVRESCILDVSVLTASRGGNRLFQHSVHLDKVDVTEQRRYDFPVSPVIRFPFSADFATGRGGLLQLLSTSLPSCCCCTPARVPRRFGQFATSHVAFAS